MSEMVKNQCMSIMMSDINEKDKLESLKTLIYDKESKKIVEDFIQFIIIED